MLGRREREKSKNKVLVFIRKWERIKINESKTQNIRKATHRTLKVQRMISYITCWLL